MKAPKEFPLTNLQLAYLIGRNDSYELGGVSTHAYYEITTQYDMDKVEEAINEIISVQPMLRAVITDNGKQKILDTVPWYRIERIDISACKEEEQKRKIEEYRNMMSHEVFPTGKWPMFSMKALHLGNGKYRYMLSIDLLIADGGSIAILAKGIIDYCQHDIAVDRPGIGFESFVDNLQKIRNTPRFEKERQYWEEQAENMPLAPSLPLKTLNDKAPRFERKTLLLSREEWTNLQNFAQKLNTSETVLLLCMYGRVLGFWSDQQAFTINYTISNRKKFGAGYEQLIGDFTSTVPLVMEIHKEESLKEQGRQVRESLFTALKHCRAFDGIDAVDVFTRKKRLENGVGLPIVFTSMLFKDRNFDAIDQFGQLEYSVSQTPQVYLDCQVMERDGRLSVTWDFIKDAFEDGVINRMFTLFERLVKDLCNENTCFANAFELDASDQKLWENYNQRDTTYEPASLYDLIKNPLRTFGEHVAVKDPDNALTYQELDRMSDQVAYELQQKGVGPGDFVGVLAERKVETIVNIIGIVKCGAAFVPLEAAWPKERLNYILRQGKCKGLLTTDFTADIASKNSITGKIRGARPSDPAYVIYTSGSTGVPKGVIISNQAVCNTILDINRRLSICSEDVFAGISSFAFDLSVYDIFGSLAAGATNILIPDSRDIPYIVETVEREHICIWNTVPALMELYIDELERKQKRERRLSVRDTLITRQISLNDGLRAVLLSGDWIPVDLPDRIWNFYEEAEIYSLGGATEASIWSIYYPIDHVDTLWNSIPYGYPLANQKIYVLNSAGELCPPEMLGEICIGGIGVAEGYQNDPEKTEAAFVEHKKYGRIYRTGDYGIFKETGFIEFKGRKDAQVKIRGHRIELGEIESVLLKHPQIAQVAVVPRKQDGNAPYLCALFTSDRVIAQQELVELAESYLPEYMIPKVFINLSEMPLTGNGKIDRKKLPEPRPEAEEYIAPRNECEKKIQEIWEEVIGRQDISVRENFFEAGGDSICMVSIAAKIEDMFGKKLSLQQFLHIPTIEGIASILAELPDAQQPNEKGDKPIVYEALQFNKGYPLTDVQMAYLLGSEKGFELGGISAHAFYDMETTLDIERFEEALNKEIIHQPMLRAVMTADSKQMILPPTLHFRIPRDDLSALPQNEQNEALAVIREEMAFRRTDTRQWPLFQFRYITLSKDQAHLMVDFNLLIADGMSMRILVDELMDFYNGRKTEPAEREYTFPAYVLDKQALIGQSEWNEARAYWMPRVAEFPEAPHVENPLSDTMIKQPHHKRIELEVDCREWSRGKDLIRKKQISSSAVLETIYSYVLAYWSNQPHHGINVTVFNRRPFHPDVEDMVGDFTSILLLDVNLDAKKTFWENAAEIQRHFLEAIEHNAYEGTSFLREISKQKGKGTVAVMPIVFTSMLFQDRRFSGLEKVGRVVYSVSQTPQVYLDCQVMEKDGKLSITWDYVEEMFSRGKVESMFRQFGEMIHLLCCESTQPEKALALNDMQRVKLEQYNRVYDNIPQTTLYEIIRDNLNNLGKKIAVKDKDTELSYEELNILSDKVAYRLEQKGIGDGDFVGVIASRCVDTIINIIGIVKSGAAYIPIDPAWPMERKKYILAQSCSKLCLEASDARPDEQTVNKPAGKRRAKPSSAAYVIYTSGSTGQPKGVIVSNQAVCNTILDINHRFDITSADKFAGISSYCFDLSVYDIFGSLQAGAMQMIFPDARNIPYIADTVSLEKLTVWNTVPSLMELYIDEMDRRKKTQEKQGFRNGNVLRQISLDEDSLSVIMLSGDWIPLGLPDRVRKHYEDARIYSLGGATEASIWSIYYPIKSVKSDWSSIPYGYPLANQQFYILDYCGRDCPIGVLGELFIGGRGLADGYLNDTEKTDAAFFKHPKYGRLYRTGDYGLFSEDGYIEFKGRRDSQVKIKGHRIELGEIEHILLKLDGVNKAAVVTRKEQNGGEYLCAYLVSTDRYEDAVVSEHVKTYLPEYMIPRRYVYIDEIPLTANGKVDKGRLPLPEAQEKVYVPARNKTEEQLQYLWERVLKIKPIGINENFFDIGGDSLSMMRIISMVNEEMNKELPVPTFLQCPTIADMSLALDRGQARENGIGNRLNEKEKCKYFLFPDIYGMGSIMLSLVESEKEGVKYYDIRENLTYKELVSSYVKDILETETEENPILIGYSLGGNLVFDVVKHLEALQIPVGAAVLLDSYYIPREYSQDREILYENYIRHMCARENNGAVYDEAQMMSEKRYAMLRNYYVEGEVQNTPVFYVESEGDEEFAAELRRENGRWNEHIKYMTKIKGYGTHLDMLKEPYAHQNWELISNLTGEICGNTREQSEEK